MQNQTTPDHNPNEFNDADFEDLALFAGVVSEEEANRAENARREEERANRAPVTYLDPGSYWLRLYPEFRTEEDGGRKVHVLRRFWSYTGLAKGVRRLPAPRDPNDPVRKEVLRLKDAKYDQAWKFQASEEGLIKACIFKSTLPKDHKYVKMNTPLFIVLRRRQTEALSTFLAELSPENLRKILDPRGSAPMIKVTYTAGAGGSASFGFDLAEAELPPLPSEFPSIFKVLIEEGVTKPADDEELLKIRKNISAILASQSNVINPSDESGAPPTRTATERQSEARGAVAGILGEGKGKGGDKPATGAKPAPAASAAAAAAGGAAAEPDPVCPSNDAALAFGRHNGDHPDCITCPFEDRCAAASDKIPY
jgi:hypothetical protein